VEKLNIVVYSITKQLILFAIYIANKKFQILQWRKTTIHLGIRKGNGTDKHSVGLAYFRGKRENMPSCLHRANEHSLLVQELHSFLTRANRIALVKVWELQWGKGWQGSVERGSLPQYYTLIPLPLFLS